MSRAGEARAGSPTAAEARGAIRLYPDRRLLHWTAVWLALAVASVPLLVLRPFVPWAAVALVAAGLADAWLAAREPALRLRRRVPAHAARERRERVTLELESALTRPVRLDLRDAVPGDLVRPEPVWSGLELPAGARRSVAYEIVPRVRGERVWGAAVALVASPLGLLRRRVEAGAGQSIRVQPETGRFLRPEALDPRRVLATLGARPRRRRGDGLEFDSLREYVLGDEPRRIDWRATARRGRPIVRTHRFEESRTIVLAVDCSRLMGARAPRGRTAEDAAGLATAGLGPGIDAGFAATKLDPAIDAGFAATKLDHAIDAGLALAFAGLVAGDRVGLLLFDRGVRGRIAPLAHRASLGRFVEGLSTVQASGFEADYRRLVRTLLSWQRKRALVVVLTDFVEIDHAELVAPMALLARQHEVVFTALREPILEQLEDEPAEGAGAAQPLEERLRAVQRRIVLADLLREREERLVHLRRRGLSVIDVPPSQATAATLNRFLELRYGAR